MLLKQLLDDYRFPEPIQVESWTVYTNGQAFFAVEDITPGVLDPVRYGQILPFLRDFDCMETARLAELQAFLGEPDWGTRMRCKKATLHDSGESCYECDDYPNCEGGEIVTYPKSRPVVIGEKVFDGNLVARFLSPASGIDLRWRVLDETLYLHGEWWRAAVMSYRAPPDNLRRFP